MIWLMALSAERCRRFVAMVAHDALLLGAVGGRFFGLFYGWGRGRRMWLMGKEG